MIIHSEIRGPGLLGQHAVAEYRALEARQPLVLTREPFNPVDPNAVIAKTVLLVPCGYVAKEHAEIIAPEMDAGTVWVAFVKSPANAFSKPKINLVLYPGRRFYDLCLEWHASPTQARAILDGKFLKPSEGEAA